MNLHGIVAGAIGAINPHVPATIKRNTGYITGGDGGRVPTFELFYVKAQVQELTQADINHMDGLNIQGVVRAVYFTGSAAGLIRAAKRGGDLIIFAPGLFEEGTDWLATAVLEKWPDWVKVAITLQNTP